MNTNIYLCNVKMLNDYNNTLIFKTKEEQENYFNSIITKTFNNYYYLRENNFVILDMKYDDAIKYNYLIYINTDYSNKKWYNFITKIEYVNETSCRIFFETDVIQTFMFEINYNQVFIERETVDNDAIGLHTFPENLENGEYIINEIGTIDEDTDNMRETLICLGTSWLPDNAPVSTQKIYNGNYSGLYYVIFSDADSCTKFCKAFDTLAKADAIYTIFLVPKGLVLNLDWVTYNLGNENGIVSAFPKSNPFSTFLCNKTLTSPSSLNGYKPKNNKLFCYPYNYLYISNNGGTDLTYNYEDFVNNEAYFEVRGAISTGCSIRLIPENYKKILTKETKPFSLNSYGIAGAKYPTCSWNSDSYTNWLTQNAVSIPNEIGNIALKSATSLVTKDYVGASLGTYFNVANVLNEIYQHKLVPEQAKGTISTGDVIHSMRLLTFSYYKMSIKSEYAKIIDNFFSIYGYKINRVKNPNLFSRKNWNYIKTIGANFTGDIPQMFLNQINSIFNNGITLWHNKDTMLDYSQNNDII